MPPIAINFITNKGDNGNYHINNYSIFTLSDLQNLAK